MRVDELNRDQLEKLKQHYLMETQMDVSYSDLASADDIVSDEDIFDYYGDVDFVPDDFYCSAGQEEDECVNFYINTNNNRSKIAEALRRIAQSVEDGVYGGRANGIEWGCDRIY